MTYSPLQNKSHNIKIISNGGRHDSRESWSADTGIARATWHKPEELAARANLDRTYITSVERGKRNISIGTLEKIVVQLNCTMHEFFNF